MSVLQRQAETLTGAHGTPLQQMVILCAAVARKPKDASTLGAQAETTAAKSSYRATGKKDKKAEVMSSADKIRLANQTRKQAEKDDSDLQWWKDQLRDTQEKPTIVQVVVMKNLMRNKRTKEGWLSVEARLYLIHLEFSQWLADPAHETATVRDHYSVMTMCIIKDLFDSKALFPTAVRKLATCLAALGLE
ncbi:hypothetical protein TRAPUB_14239 [Trametes pubescens]|uniref:Uncharacterized protein n=1 Tax=Trametes pubescens TaxID=154538 RepID=A0A1M2VP55_TRAPU|nr:hypothetical protein TRAPUB_14239 [Trametes pubescens]